MFTSLKPIDQFSPDLTFGLLLKGYCQFVQMFLLNKLAAMPIYGKILIYSIWDARSTKFVQMMIPGWPLTFYNIVKFLS